MSRVFLMAAVSAESPFIIPENRFPYNLVENPVQLPITRDSVKENIPMNTRGA